MPAKKAHFLEPDALGNMWMATEIGLVAYRPGGVLLPRVIDLGRTGKLRIPSETGKS